MSVDDILKAQYAELGSEIRHYSTVRSTVTTFLLTVALAALSKWFDKDARSGFLVMTGHAFLAAAVVICLIFSWRTDRATIRYKKVRSWMTSTTPPTLVEIAANKPSRSLVLGKVAADPMNSVLLIIVGVFCVGFWLFRGKTDVAALDPEVRHEVIFLSLVALNALTGIAMAAIVNSWKQAVTAVFVFAGMVGITIYILSH